MYFDHYGNRDNPTIVFFHGANFVHAFGRQYPLADEYYLLVPHLPGYGNEAKRTFDSARAVAELARWIQGLDRKVYLVGFSLGAQLAVQLVAEHPELFYKAVFVSPWLIKEEPELSKVKEMNLKQLKTLKKPFLCNLIGMMNGLPKAKRKEFVAQMQEVSAETQENAVDTNISLDTIAGFQEIDFPMLAIAGAKEQPSMLESVRALGELNPGCQTQIWEKAAHNIPPLHHKRFNQLLRDFFKN